MATLINPRHNRNNMKAVIKKNGLFDTWYAGLYNGLEWVGQTASYDTESEAIAALRKYFPAFALDGDVELSCMNCGAKFMGEPPKMCCSGRECGCMGMPVDPIVCDEKCYNELLEKVKNQQPVVIPFKP
jgi:hypothetical protein